ncbi:MAG: hypothetical protein DBX37_00500 [Massilioclostridium sp.]|nr:MAG: hypothetical protein DBX37_00500 [Massilioclostridium sp.]
MNEYQKLIAYLKIVYHNLTTLHRNLVKDTAWFANHKQIAKWYEDISDQIDDLTETGLALGYLEPGIKESVLAFSNECLSVQPRGPEESFRLIIGYFRTVSSMMQTAESSVPAPVANKLQEYEYHWNKEADFKLSSTIGEKSNHAEYDDD